MIEAESLEIAFSRFSTVANREMRINFLPEKTVSIFGSELSLIELRKVSGRFFKIPMS
jgi:hypothetical protein